MCLLIILEVNLKTQNQQIQEISNRAHWTDPEQTWVSNIIGFLRGGVQGEGVTGEL